MKGVSVVICCFNSGMRLVPTLNHLARQEKIEGVGFELLIIDNNCSDNTIEVALGTWESLGSIYPIRVFKQPLPGLNYARELGIRSAAFDYVILCDDDNWLCTGYFKKVFNHFEKLPDVALIGGVGEAVFQSDPPVWFQKLEGFGYAIGTHNRQSGFVESIYGAGMAIRKFVFQTLIKEDDFFLLSDRKGRNLNSGGDIEICLIIKSAGYKIFLDTTLTFKHFITADRLQWNYYLRLRKSFGTASAFLTAYNKPGLLSEMKNYNSIKRILSFAFFSGKNLHFILFPSFFKNSDCAEFTQRLSFEKSVIFERKKIKALTRRNYIVSDKSDKCG